VIPPHEILGRDILIETKWALGILDEEKVLIVTTDQMVLKPIEPIVNLRRTPILRNTMEVLHLRTCIG
jgi:hypothetical protein